MEAERRNENKNYLTGDGNVPLVPRWVDVSTDEDQINIVARYVHRPSTKTKDFLGHHELEFILRKT